MPHHPMMMTMKMMVMDVKLIGRGRRRRRGVQCRLFVLSRTTAWGWELISWLETVRDGPIK